MIRITLAAVIFGTSIAWLPMPVATLIHTLGNL